MEPAESRHSVPHSTPHPHPGPAGSTLHAALLFQYSHEIRFLKHSGKCFTYKTPKFIPLRSLSFTQNKTSKASLPTGTYVSLPGVGQLGTFATHKDTEINSYFWKLHNTKPNTSPLALLP